ncbi:MAG: hypothetical protein GX443_07730 [Deltaproteobacteria bacterium]|nr:hypothetical protein [Deltaproteobacteria bacterium]
MHEERYQVILEGLKPGFDGEHAKANLISLFKIETAKLDRLLATCPYVVKKDLSRESAERVVNVLDLSGALSRLEAMVPDVDSELQSLLSWSRPFRSPPGVFAPNVRIHSAPLGLPPSRWKSARPAG